MYSFACYTAPPLSCGLSLSRNNKALSACKSTSTADMLLRNDKQPITGSVERGTRSPHGLKELAYMKRKSAGNKAHLQPITHFFVHIGVSIARVVFQRCPLCPFRSVPVREMALCCSFQKYIEINKMRPPARRGRAQRNCEQYLDVLTVRIHSRNIPLAGNGFF